jgi:hypothetical protein
MAGLVESFVEDARLVLTDVASELGCEWAETVNVMLRAVRSEHRLPRDGRFASGVAYNVHGAGCRFITTDGAEMDLDMGEGGQSVVFDFWRVKQWAGSRGAPLPSDEDLRRELSALAARGVVTPAGALWWDIAR